ncbi:MAG: hypothetical protein AAB430_03610 [Patescibacteria group bacterium]
MSKKLLSIASLTGALLLSSGSQKIKALPDKPPELRLPIGLISQKELAELLAKMLQKILPATSRVLTDKEEDELSQTIVKTLGIKAVAELDGNRLNHQLGVMGLEQNLPRYPGDTAANRAFPQVGLASSRGAWGYIDDPEKEKYYVAVQTLYLPDWAKNAKTLKDWYKYRKVLVINPSSGLSVVAVIADAGPAQWTGKQFGGSPQVMYDLGFYPKKTAGKTILLFVADPEDKVPLGPVTAPLFKAKPVLI